MKTQTQYSALAEDYSPDKIREDFGGQRPGPPIKYFRSSEYNRADKAAFKKAGYAYGYVLVYGEKVRAWWKFA